jgi:hypothetical protein
VRLDVADHLHVARRTVVDLNIDIEADHNFTAADLGWARRGRHQVSRPDYLVDLI